MVLEEGFILLAAAKLVSINAVRNGWAGDTLMKETLKTFAAMRDELSKI